MNQIYYINLVYPKLINGAGKFVASSKATQDISAVIMDKFFVKYIPIYRHFSNKFLGSIEFLLTFFLSIRKIPRGSAVFIQYPLINLGVFKYCYKKLINYNAITIVHDLQSYRFPHFRHFRQLEIDILNSYKHIIVHSENMKKRLVSDGIITDIVVLEMFDYLLEDSMSAMKKANAIVFAGALEKSLFLTQLVNYDFEMFQLNLYGRTPPNIEFNKHIQYKGAFLPNDISKIEGEWGLLWDGDSAEVCSGNFGEYLTLIAPHKFSLYLACGLKVIVWEKSAMAKYILENHIGIAVKSLRDIPRMIKEISVEEKNAMERNVFEISRQIRHGQKFITAMNKAMES